MSLATFYLLILGEVDDNFAEKFGKNRFNLLLKYYYAIGEKDENGEIKVMKNIKRFYLI